MTPRQQIDALMAGVADQPPDIVVPCKAVNTHWFKILVRWEDDLTPVPTANFEIYRGHPQYAADIVAKGKYGQKSVPPGNYRMFFPDIHDAEIVEE
jgi:hypothetical protein